MCITQQRVGGGDVNLVCLLIRREEGEERKKKIFGGPEFSFPCSQAPWGALSETRHQLPDKVGFQKPFPSAGVGLRRLRTLL